MIIKDIYFAAFLIDNNIELEDFEKDGTFVSFIFKIDEEKLKKLKISFFNSKHNLVKTQIEKLKGLAR